MSSDDGEQPRVATVELTNAADTDEIQALIQLLEKRFAVDARMADGELHIVRDASEAGDVSASRDIDEDQTRNVVWKGEVSSQSGPDACCQRPRPEDDAEQTENDTDEQDKSEDDADESLTKRERRLQRLRQNVEDGEPYTLTELAAIAFDKDKEDVTASNRATVSQLHPDLELEAMDDPRRDGNAKLYYRGARPDMAEDEADNDTDHETEEEPSETVPCPHCGDGYAPKGLGPHRRSCPENPDNQDVTDTDQYRCGNCGEGFPTERGVKNHQNRSRDCTGADIERVEQTDDSETAASAADPSGDHENDEAEEEADDADLDPEVGAVPIDPDTVDEAVVADDDKEPVPADEPDESEDRYRVRREPSTVREVAEAAVSGRYLCVECGFISGADEDVNAVKHHDFRRHGPYTDEDGDEYRQLDAVPDDELAERWLVTYKNVGSTWTHPRLHEARKNGIVTVLEEADHFLDATQIRERLNELLQASSRGHHGRQLSHEQLVDDPGYLDELVKEDRIERDGRTWGVDAEPAAEIVEATA